MKELDQAPLTGVERELEAGSALISVSDLEGIITYCNDQLCQFTDYTQESLDGQLQRNLGAGGVPFSIFNNLYTALNDGKEYIGILKNRCKNGDHYWADVYFMPIYKNGKLAGIQSIRSKPESEFVERAKKLYPKMLSNKKDLSLIRWWRKRGFHTKLNITSGLVISFIMGTLVTYIPESTTPIVTAYASLMLLVLGSITFMSASLRKLSKDSESIIDSELARELYANRLDEIGQLQLVIHVLKAKLKTALGRVNEASEELVEQTFLSQEAVSSTQAEMQQQGLAIDSIAAAIEEMTTKVSDVARNTSDASIATIAADKIADDSRTIIKKTVTMINAMSERVEETKSCISAVEKQSEAIGDVLNVIRSIAEQTNLLALNAAIEAARAGEQGRGFAVVADEVRSLAARTQGSTSDIEEMIAALQSSTEETVQAMNISAQQASASMEQTTHATEALDNIAQQVSLINDLNTMIANATEEQSASSREIAQKVHGISASAEQTVKNSEKSLQSSNTVTELTNKLNGIISSFKM
ncbi:methyl-accepting chemotaxis protein [Marinomonas sp. PE14-40]|uniref:methyl-accepting chemotaxis protein n=1 Tax=Marinomonas sp. PE14-40 TaxID=3060621 RepID=UPI003F66CA35